MNVVHEIEPVINSLNAPLPELRFQVLPEFAEVSEGDDLRQIKSLRD